LELQARRMEPGPQAPLAVAARAPLEQAISLMFLHLRHLAPRLLLVRP